MTTARIALFLCVALSVGHACGAGLRVEDGEPARARCASALAQPEPPPISMHRLSGSDAVQGTRDIAWLWFGSATDRYGHAALGNRVHGGSLHAVLRAEQREFALTLPADTVIEDRLPRLADLDGDGRDEAVVVESDLERGAALVVYGVEGAGNDTRWVERARSEHMGGMRWLNPVGVADFDGDGRLEIAAVATPHIGGVLTLYRYAPRGWSPSAACRASRTTAWARRSSASLRSSEVQLALSWSFRTSASTVSCLFAGLRRAAGTTRRRR